MVYDGELKPEAVTPTLSLTRTRTLTRTLTRWPLARDSSYYCFGITMLVAFMVDNRIHIWEAVILLLLYFGYCTIMYFNEDLEVWVNKRVELTKQPRKPWQKSILQGFDSTLVNVLLYPQAG